MSALQSLDLGLFRFINLKLGQPLLDGFMAQLSSNAWFFPLLGVVGLALLWKGGTRGRLFVLMLALVLGLGDSQVINRVKKAVSRPRPYHVVSEARLPVGRGSSGSMPSSHTSTWFAATIVALVYYRRSWIFMLPMALLIGFSRIYLGVHYPTDVLAGALLGITYALAGMWSLERVWYYVGQSWFPFWWWSCPSLLPQSSGFLSAQGVIPSTPMVVTEEREERQWLRLGYVVVGVLLAARLWYVGSGRIELVEDEAYQWIWSKHLALSYYSKPPMIALLHWLGTHLWGDTEFGVRFCPPMISAAMSLLLLRFFTHEASARLGFILMLMANTTPLLAAGSILMTIDPPLVLFWCAAMVAGWRALQPGGTTRHWIWMGIWLGLSFLSKYTALIFVPSLALFYGLRPDYRARFRGWGPWLGLVPLLLAFVPVIVWNAGHGWVTLQHVSENAKLDKPWTFTLKPLLEFTAGEAGLLNPIFFGAFIVALVKARPLTRQAPLQTYLFAMGAPVFFGYWLYTLHSRVQLNWIAPAIVPLFGFTLLFWAERWKAGLARPAITRWLIAGLVLGGAVVIVLHDTDLVRRIAKVSLPVQLDPLRRARAIREITRTVTEARLAFQKTEGRETFIIASHYGLTGQITFYSPEARAGLPQAPLVYVKSSRAPKNQFYFWPEYRYGETRKGQNAIYVTFNDTPRPPPPDLAAEFESITDLGVQEVRYGNRVFHRIQLYRCQHLR